MYKSHIEWCHHTANLWWGCTKVHTGCDHCYACSLAHRYHHNVWGSRKPRKVVSSTFEELLRFQKKAQKAGEVHRVFVGSMMDVFERPMPLVDWNNKPLPYNTDALRQQLFANISAGLYPNLDFLFLTKRPANINKYIPAQWKTNPPGSVMFGTSVVDQATADKYIPQLLNVNGRRFLSVEPLLDTVDLTAHLANNRIEWVIVGGESGPKARPMDEQWVLAIKQQCKTAGVTFFFKQWGGKNKKQAGRLLQGREWNAMPSSRNGKLSNKNKQKTIYNEKEINH